MKKNLGKKELSDALKNNKYNDLETVVFRRKSKYNEKGKNLEKRIIAENKIFQLTLGLYTVGKSRNTLKTVFLEKIEVDNTANHTARKNVMSTPNNNNELQYNNLL